MKRSFSYSSKASALSNLDIGFIKWFLDELRNSNNLIIKVDDKKSSEKELSNIEQRIQNALKLNKSIDVS